MTSRNRLRASSLIFSFSSIVKFNSRFSFAEPFTVIVYGSWKIFQQSSQFEDQQRL